MEDIALKIENVSKQYRVGEIGTGSLSHDLNRWFHKIRGKEDPYLKVGEANDRTSKGGSEYVWALKDINIDVKKGEILGVIGKNGAGKSTLLKVLSKVTGPTTGQICYNGRIASLLEVGTGFHPELTGRENIFMNGTIMGMTKTEIQSKLDEIVEFAGIERYLDTPTKRYSSGMTVRLGFAIAAHLEPEILVVDEVLAVGDAEFQKKAIGKMQEVSQGEGRTVLFVSHNMASIQNLCTRTVVMENGTVAFKGDVKDGVDYYMSSNLKYAYLSLEDRKDRGGVGTLKFTNISLRDNNLKKIDEVVTGKDLKIDLDVLTKDLVRTPKFRIIFQDTKGVVRFLCNNAFSMIEEIPVGEELQESRNIIRCNIPKFPLPKGEYIVQLTCFSENGIEDDLEGALKVNVAGGDFYGTGREQVMKEGVMIENSFELIQ